MDKQTKLAIDLGQIIYTNTINNLTEQRDRAVKALEFAKCKTKGIKASAADREDFAERCSIMWQNEPIDRARKNAFFCVFVSTVD